jgi:hypothetical protein
MSIPKGLRHKAQGCAGRATLGKHVFTVKTLKGLRSQSQIARAADRMDQRADLATSTAVFGVTCFGVQIIF